MIQLDLFRKKTALSLLFCCSLFLLVNSCASRKNRDNQDPEILMMQQSKINHSGGSSGMEVYGAQSFIVAYDLKSHKEGVRFGLIRVGNESLEVRPFIVKFWDEDGRPNDLESICHVPGKPNEFLTAESGNWKGELGRIFHIKIDTTIMIAEILGSVKFPMLDINDMNNVGDQYESIICLPLDENTRIVILGERGGSSVNPDGLLRWGILNLITHQLNFSKDGMSGLKVNAPGEWQNSKTNRDITDLHLDDQGILWAAASEDQSDSGPFYSIIYKLGSVNINNEHNPISLLKELKVAKEVAGFKIEALSGPPMKIDCELSFGTEDEMYGGVWRAVKL